MANHSLEKVLIGVCQNEQWGVINGLGESVVPFAYEYAGSGVDFCYAERDGFLTIFDHLGAKCSQVKGVSSYSDFADGRLAVETNDERTKIICPNGEFIPGEFEAAQSFKGGFALVEVDGGWGVIDKLGNKLIPPIFDQPGGFELQSKSFAGNRDGVWVIRSLAGKEHFVRDAEIIARGNGVFVAGVRQGTDIIYGIMETNGNWRLAPRFSDVSDCSDDNIAVKENGTWKLIDLHGRPFFEIEATALQSLNCGAAAAYFGGTSGMDGLWGGKFRFLDRNGKLKFPGEFDDTFGFSNGIARVGMLINDERETSTGYINTEGKVIWPLS